jgi:tripartite-type tricarboxylate transporter receptor subunit TctC
MRRLLLSSLSALGLMVALNVPAAAEYPEQTITIIVPTSAGGATDVGARTWAEHLETCLGNGATTAVVNMSGAGGVIGFTQLANSPNDGYTLGVLLMPNLATSVVANSEVTYNLDSFEYLGNLFGNAITLGVAMDSEIKSIEELLDRASKGPVTVGVAAIGNDDFLLVHSVVGQTGAQFVPVPLDGSAKVNPALIGGHIESAAISITSALSDVERLRPLAVATAERVPEFPDLPTLKEKGVDVIATSTHVIGAPAGIPAEAKEKLSACFAKFAADPEFQAVAKERKMRMLPLSAEATEQNVRTTTENLQKLWETDPWM